MRGDKPAIGPEERLPILAHELASPVAALSGLAEAVGRIADEEGRRKAVRLAVAAARDIERLLLDPELLSLRRRPVTLEALLSGFAGPRVTVEGRLETVVDADPTRIRQAVSNLVANGLRHGSRVVIEAGAQGGVAVVDVSDDGPGVPPGFDPFARGAGTAGSTGYGLWLARAVLEAHGGTLELLGDGAPGARFRLALPLASADR